MTKLYGLEMLFFGTVVVHALEQVNERIRHQ